ncbi:hypothetical protein [Actinosynnema sp. NPDC020468]|uniref:hypothetical protein n=1 Tax=Actinosynnema sp. NPDC020468 TaxID=3154488 RepID=UPI0033F3EF4D
MTAARLGVDNIGPEPGPGTAELPAAPRDRAEESPGTATTDDTRVDTAPEESE